MTRQDLADRLDAISRQYFAEQRNNGGRPPQAMLDDMLEAVDEPSDAAIEGWIRRNPQPFEALMRKRDRINGEPPTARTPRRRTGLCPGAKPTPTGAATRKPTAAPPTAATGP